MDVFPSVSRPRKPGMAETALHGSTSLHARTSEPAVPLHPGSSEPSVGSDTSVAAPLSQSSTIGSAFTPDSVNTRVIEGNGCVREENTNRLLCMKSLISVSRLNTYNIEAKKTCSEYPRSHHSLFKGISVVCMLCGFCFLSFYCFPVHQVSLFQYMI